MRLALAAANRLAMDAPIPVMSAPGRFEPGIFGIWRPVLLLPEGITAQLTASQLAAVMAHELCHARRRDNLTGAVQMAVEAIFWFHPLVRWLTSRLIEERERACDEEVLRLGHDPQVYAEGILRTCRLYLGVPVACGAGGAGADLRKRIEAIAAGRIGREMEFGRKLALAMVGIAAIAVPIGVGILTSPRLLLAQTEAERTESDGPRFQQISITPGTPAVSSSQSDHSIDFPNITLKTFIGIAFRSFDFQIEGGPAWLDSERFHIAASTRRRAYGPILKELEQAMLTDRFKLECHRETRELPNYALEGAANGLGLTEVDEDCSGFAGSDNEPCANLRLDSRRGELTARNVAMRALATSFSTVTGRMVEDRTGLAGTFDATLHWPPGETQSFVKAVREQLGLQMEESRGPVRMLIIDTIERPAK
jgi:uncharacterized protein (TIGR03435 family)